MSYRQLTITQTLIAAALMVAGVCAARAQEEGFPGLEAAAEAEAPVAAPAAGAPTAEAGDAAADAPTLADYARRDSTVAAVLELPRNTPSTRLRAVLTLIDLGHPEVARLVLPELLGEELDDAQKAALVREFGAARFMKLIRLDATPAAEAAAAEAATPETPEAPAAPAGDLAGLRAFAQSALDAAAEEARDPKRIAALVAQLNAPSEEERYSARVDLGAVGAPAMGPVLAALAAAKTEAERANLLSALVEMRPAVDEPLLAVLAEGSGQVRRDAAELAGHLRMRAALPWLAALTLSEDAAVAAAARRALEQNGIPLPTPPEVQELLRQRLTELAQSPPPSADEPPREWWSWNQATGQLSSSELPATAIRTLSRARLVRALAEAGGVATAEDRRLAALSAWEEAAQLGRELSPAQTQFIASLTPAELSSALAEAVDDKHFAAAVQLAGELGRRGDASILATSDGRPSPLAAALASPMRSLKFAALEAIMQLAPTQSFPGSSQVAEALWYFAAGAGDPTVVAAAPAITRASDWAGRLRGLGYDATPVGRGFDALVAALDPANSSRLALVMIDGDIGQPLMGEVVYQLHANSRTAGVPVLIASSAPRLTAAERLAEHDRLVLAAPRPRTEESLRTLVDATLALTRQPLAPAEERSAQAAQALTWIAKLLAEGAPYDELRRDAAIVNRTLFLPGLAEASIQVLTALGTAPSQAALVDLASAGTAPIESRRAAGAAFARSVERFGLQLSREQMLAQYDRYNASESADAQAQAVLGQVLDVIEKKNSTAKLAPGQ